MDENDTAPAGLAQPADIHALRRKMKVSGTVTRTELYGAFVDLGVGTDAIIHVSQLGGDRVNRVADALSVGDTVTVWIDRVDPERQQILVTMVEPLAVDWADLAEGQVYEGKITRLENFGAFVDIGAEKDGLVHVSEISHDYLKHPSEVLSVGDTATVKVLAYSKRKRRINLSIKALLDRPEAAGGPSEPEASFEEDEVYEEMPTAMEIALRSALGEDVSQIKPRRPSRGGGRRRSRKSKLRAQQDDLLSRTLEYSK